MKLIVGLGNPGKEYKMTRHNIGFIILDYYFESEAWKNNSNDYDEDAIRLMIDNMTSVSSWKEKFDALYKDITIEGEKIIFVKPTTYMNLSGDAVIKFVNFYKINPEDILIIQDDLDLPFGKIRIKYDSSSGGHNGIKSIINNLGTQKFGRLKIGISHNATGDTKNYVLGIFTEEEQKKLISILPKTNKIINDFICYNIKQAMINYNNN